MTLAVVSYDPLRRLGFLRIVEPLEKACVHFSLGMLPEAFKAPIVAASRPLNYHREMVDDQFKQWMRVVRQEVVGARFRAVVTVREDGRLRMRKRTIVHLPGKVLRPEAAPGRVSPPGGRAPSDPR